MLLDVLKAISVGTKGYFFFENRKNENKHYLINYDDFTNVY